MIYCHFEGVNFFQEIKSWAVSSHLAYLTPNFEFEIRKIGCITFVSTILHLQGKNVEDLFGKKKDDLFCHALSGFLYIIEV